MPLKKKSIFVFDDNMAYRTFLLVPPVQYYGMSDQYGLVTSSIVYLDLQMSLFAPGLEQYDPVFDTSLYDFQPLELCHTSFYPQEEGSSCPSSGEYKIMSSITLPAVAGYKSWLYTGYKGTAELSIYQGSDSSSAVLGQCTLNIYTEVERDEDGNVIMANIPNGFDTLVVVLSCVAVMLLLGICVLYCSCRRRGSKVGVSQLKKLPSFRPIRPTKFSFKPEEVDGAFKIMEEATDNETNKGWKNTPEPTRGFFNCSA